MDIIDKITKQEEELQFNSFSAVDAWEIGTILVNKGKMTSGITIDITKNRQQLFHYSFDGTSADNDEWVRRKTNTVYRFFHSSFLIGQQLKKSKKTIEEAYLIPEAEYAAHGGCFPIIIKNTGVIGTITVSGLAQEDDHNMVVEALREYLDKNKTTK